MTSCGNLRAELRQIAADLRPPGQRFIPVLKIAHQLGVRVCVRLERGCIRQTARIELATTTPTIYMTRQSPIEGDRRLERHEDHLLTPRERFSVAHELGHLVAFRELQVSPARERSEYWVQEECMHGFAAALLMPESLVDDWLSSVPVGEPVSPFALRHWARNTAKLSEEVVATQLCQRRPEIGFMKVVSTRRQKDNGEVLHVLFAASGEHLSLPRTHSHIKDEELLEKVTTEGTGTATMRRCKLWTSEPQDIRIAWRQAGAMKKFGQRLVRGASTETNSIFWISATFQKLKTSDQLALW